MVLLNSLENTIRIILSHIKHWLQMKSKRKSQDRCNLEKRNINTLKRFTPIKEQMQKRNHFNKNITDLL